MCGIVGQVFLDGVTPVDAALIRGMTDILVHRGPDGEGHYVAGPIGLGHRRLSIIDISDAAAQPMCNEDGTVWITFNGEIYNYLELRKELELLGHKFQSRSDTEVIVHLYEEHGDECVQRLKGMFAFAIWDERERRLFAARDRLGIKPLYYHKTATTLSFASEIKALFVDSSVPRQLNLRAVDRFLTYYYVPGEQTLFRDVLRLLPGHCLTVQNGSVVTRQYWDLDFRATAPVTTFGDAVESLQSLLSKTVRSHLISDVPVGVLLSGGVDSTAMLRYAAMHSSGPLNTFTVGFDDESVVDERPYARLASKRFGAKHHEITLTAKEFGELLPKYVWHMEEPVCEPPAIALFAVARLARNCDVKVVLSGEGGDEAFGGYNRYGYLLALEKAKSLVGSKRKDLLRLAMGAFARMGMASLRNYIPMLDMALNDYYLSCTSSPFTVFNSNKQSLFNDASLEELRTHDAHGPTRRIFETSADLPVLNQMLRVDTKTWLPDDLLIKADKMTMATSVELRVPMLDSDVMEFAAALPPSFKVRGWPPKRVLRAALRDQVPKEILHRKKVGFPVPYGRWLREDLRELMRDTILARDSGLREIFRPEGLSSVIQQEDSGRNVSQEVFSLFVLELLCQKFIRH